MIIEQPELEDLENSSEESMSLRDLRDPDMYLLSPGSNGVFNEDQGFTSSNTRALTSPYTYQADEESSSKCSLPKKELKVGRRNKFFRSHVTPLPSSNKEVKPFGQYLAVDSLLSPKSKLNEKVVIPSSGKKRILGRRKITTVIPQAKINVEKSPIPKNRVLDSSSDSDLFDSFLEEEIMPAKDPSLDKGNISDQDIESSDDIISINSDIEKEKFESEVCETGNFTTKYSKNKKCTCIIKPNNCLKKKWDNYIAFLIVRPYPSHP